jgi:hypothetical protein
MFLDFFNCVVNSVQLLRLHVTFECVLMEKERPARVELSIRLETSHCHCSCSVRSRDM